METMTLAMDNLELSNTMLGEITEHRLDGHSVFRGFHNCQLCKYERDSESIEPYINSRKRDEIDSKQCLNK